MKSSKTFLLIWCAILGIQAVADVSLPRRFNFDGVLTDNNGLPITTSQIVDFKIYDPSSTCLLYAETQTVLPDFMGSFSVAVGSGVASSSDPGLTWPQIFQNNATVRPSGANCTAGYTPAAGDDRKLTVTVAGTTLSPAFSMTAIPMANVAQTLQGFGPSQFLQLGGAAAPNLTQANLNSMFVGANYSNLQSVMAGGIPSSAATGVQVPAFGSQPSAPVAGSIWYNSTSNTLNYYNGTASVPLSAPTSSVTSVTAGAGLSGGTITSVGTISMPNVGTASTYTKVTTDAQGRVSSGSQITGSDITSGTIAGNTAVNTTGNITSATSNSTTAGTYTMNIYKNGSTLIGITAPATLTASYGLVLPPNAGVSNQFLATDGTGNLTWQYVAGANGGTVTNVGLSLPSMFSVSGSPVTASGTLSASLANQTANMVFAGPTSGGPAAPNFRSLTPADLPSSMVVSAAGALNVGTSTAQSVNLVANGSPLLTVTPSGNVGIGTTTPGQNLSVYNTIASGANAVQIENPAATGASRLIVVDDWAGTSGTFSMESYGSSLNYGNFGASNVRNSSGASLFWEGAGGPLSIAAKQSYIRFYTGGEFASNEHMRITNAGNVGIGTTTPAAPLSIDNTNASISGNTATTFSHVDYAPGSSPAANTSVIGLQGQAGTVSATNMANGTLTGVQGDSGVYSGSTVIGQIIGIKGNVSNSSTAMGSSSASGVSSSVNNSGSLNYIYGVLGNLSNTGIINGYSGLQLNFNNSGTISNIWGIYINTMPGTVTNKYGIYVADSTAANVFMGNVGIGVGNPAVALDLRAKTDAVVLPSGTSAQRPGGVNGAIRYNNLIGDIETFSASSGGGWIPLHGQHGVQKMISGTSFTVPLHVTHLKLNIIGHGGGGGGGATPTNGGSGGAGWAFLEVMPGSTINISFGTGPGTGVASSNGNPGSTITVTYNVSTITATGGAGGLTSGGAAGANGTFTATGAYVSSSISAPGLVSLFGQGFGGLGQTGTGAMGTAGAVIFEY